MCPEQEDKEKGKKCLVKNYIRQSLHRSLKCLSATLVTKQKGQLQILSQFNHLQMKQYFKHKTLHV